MLRKRCRSAHKDHYKDHLMHDSSSDSCFQSAQFELQNQKSSSFFSVPGLFIGFGIKGVSDYESAWSPTSPLDYKFLTNLRNPFGSPKNCSDAPHKSWDCTKVGLGIVDSLDDVKKPCENVILGSHLRINVNVPCCESSLSNSAPKSQPENHGISPYSTTNSTTNSTNVDHKKTALGDDGVVQLVPRPIEKVRSCLSNFGSTLSPLTRLTYRNANFSCEGFSSDKKPILGSSEIDGDPKSSNSLGAKPSSLPISIGSDHGLFGSVHASEIELSEDYTCVISHGPNPRTTHIFGDCILECHANELVKYSSKNEELGIGFVGVQDCSNSSPFLYPSDDFLSFCDFCKKKLEVGKDVYMYRGEKAFCSSNCRDQEILIEEEMEKSPANNSSNNSPKLTCSDVIIFC
ncbi:hypothetical protein Syun_011322 [Stephania yunnanensis]|uniref:FLZ-type domain-containing protein n=1 Tax=Stephania yunnanensis TaxID=152371 RepID=A0AAP0PFB6_9MAGN